MLMIVHDMKVEGLQKVQLPIYALKLDSNEAYFEYRVTYLLYVCH